MSLPTNHAGHLEIGGVDALTLAADYQTPLVVYDVAQIRQQVRAFQHVFETAHVDGIVSYASKAFASIAMYQVMQQLNAHIDVVSGGELTTAIAAQFPMPHVSFHGNNKSEAELVMALDAHVGTIIVDNFHELALLDHLTTERQQPVDILLRITPGISAHTHEYDQTGQVDSKFGFDLDSNQATTAVAQAMQAPYLNLRGIHAHIGSQIFALEGFIAVTHKLMSLLADWAQTFDFTPEVLNVGGGFGIAYTESDDPLTPEAFVQAIVEAAKADSKALQISLPQIWIEPGRAIVGPAGYSLYTIGSRKDVSGLLPYVAVDGGMGDNIRPALYQAKYEAVLASAPQAPATETVHLVGKYCESGDILIDRQPLPTTHPGDIVAVCATGAYGYAMASNYNRNPRPAVVFVENGQAKIVVSRETFADLIHLDQSYL
ncbi:diaminopimelate decarboxylase [Lacticaseibacillus saniviri]